MSNDSTCFKKWVESLDWNELQAAMEFALDPEKNNEDELFLKMVRGQAPLPTPIHPRALPGKKPSRAVVDDDGQNAVQRILRARIQQPRLFQWIETGRKQPLPLMNPRKNNKRDRRLHQPVYDIIARKFVVNGERLSLGCTLEQQTADEGLLLGTVVVEDPVGMSRRILSRRVRFCGDSSPRGDDFLLSSSGVRPSDALRMLRVASRGHFLSFSGTDASTWFHPTERWFSLSMYLSSRFERALWESFSRRVVEQSPCRWMPTDSLPSSAILASMIKRAIVRSFVSLLRNDRKELQSPHYPPMLSLEFVLENPFLVVSSATVANGWRPVVSPTTRDLVEVEVDLNKLLMCDLVLVDSPLDQLRRETCRLLYESLVCFCQEQLESSFLEETQRESDSDHAPLLKPSKRKRNKRGKLQRTQDPTPVIMEVREDTIADTSDNDDELLEVVRSMNSNRVSFPENGTCPRDRNRNTVLCMSILQEILNGVFETVGLELDVEWSFGDVSPLDSGGGSGKLGGDEVSDAEEVTGRSYPDAASKSLEWKDAHKSTCTLQESLTVSSASDCNEKLRDSGQPTAAAVVSLTSTLPEPETTEQYDHDGDMQPSEHLISDSSSRGAPVLDSFVAEYGTIGGTFYHRPEAGFVWDLSDHDWGRIQGLPSREQSLLAEFFKGGAVVRVESGTHELLMASSTAASVDSCSEQAEGEDELGDAGDGQTCPVVPVCSPNQHQCDMEVVDEEQSPPLSPAAGTPTGERVDNFESRSPSPQAPATPSPTLSPILVSLADLKDLQKDALHLNNISPDVLGLPAARSFLSLNASSLPSSPYTRLTGIATSLSREDLARAIEPDTSKRKTSPKSASVQAERHLNLTNRVVKSRDDQELGDRLLIQRKSTDALSSYRNSYKLAKAKDDHDIKHSGFRSMEPIPSRSRTSCRSAFASVVPSTPESLSRHAPTNIPFDVGPQHLCARSEIAPDGHEDSHHWQISQRSHSAEEADINTVTKDGSTTITSALSHREPEELSALREERNAYRDMCLTLGAEVAKLNNLLAAQRGTASASRHGHTSGIPIPFQDAAFFGPEAVSNPFALASKARTLAAMSDAGYKVEHESLASEDDVGGRVMKGDTIRHASSGTTCIGSDVSIEHINRHNLIQLPQSIPPQRDLTAIAFHGTQSRLAREVFLFVESVNSQLRKQDPKRQLAVERMTRLVNTLWPRAQVKLYGSHVTGLCLPSSDLDFVIRLPAVHKKAVAAAAGALEGRNAINETSQKLLARKLKGESWIDPRSMKLIERTVVPVIKVSTKDTKAKLIQLDITFDAPGHHGIQAIRMVSEILEELPMIRPLVLVLKQFLLDRGLLTAYTGGLSSYCLFLMVTRYLQEQSSAYGDAGSLLMGFLDFYGNHFDPRSTGMSVSRREYFARPTSGVARIMPAPPPPTPMWNPPHFLNPGPGAVYGTPCPNFFRRNSFSDRPSSVDNMRGGVGPMLARPRRFQTASPLPHQATFVAPVLPSAPPPPPPQEVYPLDNHRIPYTFDPLWVEDPLSETNNVGRNAFRFLQVQRAFSDAHRALVAALEWEVQSTTGELHDACHHEYPLLKCLLQSEDVVFEL